MKQVKLIALDMDGTLLNDDGVVSPFTQNVIERARTKNIEVILSTGRPLPMCESYADELQLTSYIITSNGAEIWNNRTLFERHPMDASQIEKLWNLGDENDFHMWMVAADELFVNRKRPDNFHTHEWLKLGYGSLDEPAKDFLLAQLKHEPNIEVTNSSLSNIEINKAGVHKARAIQSICENIGISMEEVMAVGDSLNDLKMIEQAGVGVAVKNAQQLILETADYISETNNDDGVAKAIKKFAL